MTNADEIRQMSDEELAKFIMHIDNIGWINNTETKCHTTYCSSKDCYSCCLKWLGSEIRYLKEI